MTTTIVLIDPWLLTAAVALTTACFFLWSNAFGTSKLPPGPPSGYLGKGRFDMPAEPYKRFMELAKAYGAWSTLRNTFFYLFRPATSITFRSPLFLPTRSYARRG